MLTYADLFKGPIDFGEGMRHAGYECVFFQTRSIGWMRKTTPLCVPDHDCLLADFSGGDADLNVFLSVLYYRRPKAFILVVEDMSCDMYAELDITGYSVCPLAFKGYVVGFRDAPDDFRAYLCGGRIWDPIVDIAYSVRRMLGE